MDNVQNYQKVQALLVRKMDFPQKIFEIQFHHQNNFPDKIDFKNIVHNGSLIGVLNFNLMIPVEDAQIQRIDTKIRKHDNMDTRRKKELLIKELE